jgi:hypothetical protein
MRPSRPGTPLLAPVSVLIGRDEEAGTVSQELRAERQEAKARRYQATSVPMIYDEKDDYR